MTTDELLQALEAHYGPAFTALSVGRDPRRVWRDWDDARASMSPAMLSHTVANLPQQPCTALGFRAHAHVLAHKSQSSFSGLTPERIGELDRLRNAQCGERPGDQWARRLRERERNGERLTPTIAAMWREALKGKP